MKKKPTHSQKSPAQAMVEFALVLPILLLVIYGLLEVGRLLFIYSSVVSAARQAARYAATTGVNGSGVFRYRDCDGIRAAAKKVAFIDRFEDADIEIWHDEGEGVNEVAYCPAGTAVDTTFTPSIGNINRVRVRVRSLFSPIVPIVPLDPFEIESFSARTILVNVPIIITAAPQGWDPSGTSLPTNTQTPTITFTPSQTGTATNTPTASNTPTITGTATKTGTPTKTSTPTQTPTNTSTPMPCDVRHSVLKTSPFGMTIFNNAALDVHISQIQIYWGPIVNPNEAITNLLLAGVNIWTGSEPGSPAVFSAFTGDVTIPAGGNKLLQVSFLKNYTVYGTEQILVTFAENGCPTLDSSNSSQLP